MPQATHEKGVSCVFLVLHKEKKAKVLYFEEQGMS